MLVPDFEIPSYLPDNPDALISVNFPGSHLPAFSATPIVIRALAKRGMINGESAKRPYFVTCPNGNQVMRWHLKYCRLLVPVAAARRIQKQFDRPDVPQSTITKPRGAKQWPVRFDRAKGGQIGGLTSFAMNQGERREMSESEIAAILAGIVPVAAFLVRQ